MKNRYLAAISVSAAVLMLGSTLFARAESVPQTPANSTAQALPPEERGDLLMAHQEYAAAIDAYSLAPRSAVIWNKIGIAYHHLEAIDEARRDYERALLIRPNYPEALNNLGATYFAERDYKKAIKLYRNALRLMPTSAVIAANLGTAYFARGKYRQGIAAYQTAFSLDPNVFDGMNILPAVPGTTTAADRARQDYCLAELFAQAGMEDRAIEFLRQAFDDGFTDRNRIMQDALLARLRTTAQFAQLMAEQKQH